MPPPVWKHIRVYERRYGVLLVITAAQTGTCETSLSDRQQVFNQRVAGEDDFYTWRQMMNVRPNISVVKRQGGCVNSKLNWVAPVLPSCDSMEPKGTGLMSELDGIRMSTSCKRRGLQNYRQTVEMIEQRSLECCWTVSVSGTPHVSVQG